MSASAARAGQSHRARLLVLAALVVGLGLMVAYLKAPSQKPVPAMEKLSIAVPAAPHAALLHIAVAKRYFVEEGLDVTAVSVGYGKMALEALAQGRVDLAAAAELPFVVNVMNQQRIVVVATLSSATAEMAVVARRDRGSARPADLVGKKIGVTLGTSGEYFLSAFLTRHRLAANTVTLMNTAPERLSEELAAGRMDAVVAWQPVRSRAQAALGAEAVVLIEPNAYTATYILAGGQAFVQQQPVTMAKLMRALLKAEAFLSNDPQRALQLVAQRLGVAAEVLQPSWADQSYRVDMLQQQLVTMEDEARWALARGYAGGPAIPNFLPHLHIATLLAVQPERVTVVH